MNCCRYKFVKQNGKLYDKGTDCKSAPAGGSYGKMGIGLLSAGLTYTPEPITTTIGIGIGLVDVFGGFNGFYNWLDDQQMLYENFGVLMLPRPFGPF